jgi:hypothetical protein
MKGAPKVMPLILLYWPMTSEVDAGVMAVEVEPSDERWTMRATFS